MDSMDGWLVTILEGASERDAEIARAFWAIAHVWTEIKFVNTSRELKTRFGLSSEHELRKIQMAACTVQAPDSTCRQCNMGLRWRAKNFGSRGDFQRYVDAWKASVCNECRAANAAQQHAEREEQDRAWKAQAAERKEKLRARYGDRAIGDCPQCEGILIIRKSQSNGGVFIGCSEYPNCGYTAPVPKPGKVSAEEIAEAKKMLADAPKCGKCGAPMRRIEGKYGAFLGCSQYPRCRETVSLAPKTTQPAQPEEQGKEPLPDPPQQPPMTFEEQERAKMQAELVKPWSEA